MVDTINTGIAIVEQFIRGTDTITPHEKLVTALGSSYNADDWHMAINIAMVEDDDETWKALRELADLEIKMLGKEVRYSFIIITVDIYPL